MPASRIAPLAPPYDPSIADGFSRVMPPGVEPLKLFRTMAHSPRVLSRMFAGALLDKGAISLREREIAILRTCVRCGCEYEWGVHVTFFSGKATLTEEEVAATITDEHLWNGRDALIVRLVDELHDTAQVSDTLWEALSATFAADQILELLALCGYYHTISFIANTMRVENEPYAARFAQMPAQETR